MVILGPDINADLLPLVQQPASWTPRPVLIYIQHLLADAENDLEVGPNWYGRLAGAGFFAQIGPVWIEAGSVKDWSPDGIEAAAGIARALERLRAAGGSCAAVCLDEPLTSGRSSSVNLDADGVTPGVQRCIDAVRGAGVEKVHHVEGYPLIRSGPIIHLHENLQRLNTPFSGLTLDVDHAAFTRYSFFERLREHPKDVADLHLLRDRCASWGIPLHVILTPEGPNGQGPVTDAAMFRASAEAWLRELPEYFGGWPDVLLAQSWEHRALPPTLPESDPNSLTALAQVAAHALQEHP